MHTIYNELEYAENILKNPPDEVKYNDINILRKYYFYLGYKLDHAVSLFDEYCLTCDPNYSKIVNRKKRREFIKKYGTGFLKLPREISITKSELEAIKSFKDIKKQKILFAMLCLAKDENYGGKDFYTNKAINHILSCAKVYYSRSDKELMIKELTDTKFIRTTYNASTQIFFVDNDSEVIIKFSDMENMMNYFPTYCEKCNEQVKLKKRGKYLLCEKCYEEKRKEDVKNNVKNLRKKKCNQLT